MSRRVRALSRVRFGVVLAAAVALGASAREAGAAAEVHRLNLVISAIPTQVAATDFNKDLDQFNRLILEPQGLEGIKKITFAWYYDFQLRYFVRQNVAVCAGVGQLRSATKREYLPAIEQDVELRAEMLSVPVHVGGLYYFQPYNQGDFQARAYLGGGLMSLVYNRERFGLNTTFPGASFQRSGRGDSPGYYVEAGAHMFFAARYSVLVGVIYRSAKIRNLEGIVHTTAGSFRVPVPNLDTSGVGARMAVGIGM